MTTREQRIDACKARALAVLDNDTLRVGDGLHTMIDCMRQHPDLAEHVGIYIGIAKMQTGEIATKDDERTFILGFN